MNPHFHTDFSISDSLIFVRKSVLIYETIIVIGVDISSNSNSGFLDVVIQSQISFLILEAAEPSLNHDVVSPTAFSIHTLTDTVFFYKFNVLLTCELTTLIRVQNLWF